MFLLFRRNTFFWCSSSLGRILFPQVLAPQGERRCLCSGDPRPILQILLRQEVQDIGAQDRRDRWDCPRPRFCALASINMLKDVLIMKRSADEEEAVKSCQIANEWARSSPLLRLSRLSDRSFIGCHDHPVYHDLDNSEIWSQSWNMISDHWSSDGAPTILYLGLWCP